MFNLGFGELALILVVALLVLGPKLLPEIATGLGKVIREIRKATSDIRQDIEVDEMIRGPLRELRDAATLPPEELKRRDAAAAARRKAEADAAARRQEEAKAAEEAKRREMEEPAKLAAGTPPLPAPAEVITAGGTMISNSPPTDDLRTLTPVLEAQEPLPQLETQPPEIPVPPLPAPPPPPAARHRPPADATVVDLQAQLKATAEAKGATTIPGRPVLQPTRAPLYKPSGDKKG